jgi:chemotaxis signal transduction protein
LEAGLVCDQAYGVLEISPADLQPATVLKAGRLPEFVIRELDGPDARIGVLDIAAVLESARIAPGTD